MALCNFYLSWLQDRRLDSDGLYSAIVSFTGDFIQVETQQYTDGRAATCSAKNALLALILHC